MKSRCFRFILPLVVLFAAEIGFAQTNQDDYLRVAQSAYERRASGVRFAGKQVKRGDVCMHRPGLTLNDVTYNNSDADHDGFVAEDLKTGEIVVYQPTEFTIEKWQLDWAFSQSALNLAPGQSSR